MKGKASRLMATASPYNKRIEPTAGGRHVHCLRNGRAGSPPAARLPASACGPSSRLIRALYGRNYFIKTKKSICLIGCLTNGKKIGLSIFCASLLACNSGIENKSQGEPPRRGIYTKRKLQIDSTEYSSTQEKLDILLDLEQLRKKSKRKPVWIRIVETKYVWSENYSNIIEFAYDSSSFEDLTITDKSKRNVYFRKFGFMSSTGPAKAYKYRLILNRIDSNSWHVHGQIRIIQKEFEKEKILTVSINGNFEG